MAGAGTIRIRALNPEAAEEVELVARRMRETLMEVLGEDRGRELYALSWLEKRVRQHLDPEELTGEVFLAEANDSVVTGHTIVRLDDDGFGNPIGLFSTVFVAREHRRAGIARALLDRGERWMLAHGRNRAVTYTDEANKPLQRLFIGHGYSMVPMPRNFVALSRELG